MIRPRAALVAGALLLAACGSPSGGPAATAPSGGPSATAPSPTNSARSVPTLAHPGAAALAGDARTARAAAPVPSPAAAPDDAFAREAGCQTPQDSAKVIECTFGDTSEPAVTVAAVGDSVVGQWLPALVDIASSRHWRLLLFEHSRCPWTATMTVNTGETTPYTTCHDWGASVLRQLLDSVHPDVVLTSDRPVLGVPGDTKPTPASQAAVARGMATYWRRLIAGGSTVVPLRETPELGLDVPTCLASKSVGACTVPRARAVRADVPTVLASADLHSAHVHLVDMTPYLCAATTCAPVVGGVVVYRDRHHLTATYVRTAEPYLRRALLAVPQLAG